jgi:hypothetical protein
MERPLLILCIWRAIPHPKDAKLAKKSRQLVADATAGVSTLATALRELKTAMNTTSAKSDDLRMQVAAVIEGKLISKYEEASAVAKETAMQTSTGVPFSAADVAKLCKEAAATVKTDACICACCACSVHALTLSR